MNVAFCVGIKVHHVNAPALEVVRLIASVYGLGTVDVEPFPDQVQVRVPGTTGRGPTEEAAAQDFLRRILP